MSFVIVMLVALVITEAIGKFRAREDMDSLRFALGGTIEECRKMMEVLDNVARS